MGKVGIGEIEAIRQQLHSIIDNQIDNFIKQHKADIAGVSEADIEDESIRYNLLKSKTSILKGTKPISVTFSDGHTEHTNTWKK